MIYFDSCPESCSQGSIRLAAKNIVRNSGWWKSQTPESWKKTAWTKTWAPSREQGSGFICGVHVILNAWAYMLGITLTDHKVHLGRHFYERALEVINLAMEGRMNSLTLRTFLQDFKYCQFQTIDELRQGAYQATPKEKMRRKVETSFINKSILTDVIERAAQQEDAIGSSKSDDCPDNDGQGGQEKVGHGIPDGGSDQPGNDAQGGQSGNDPSNSGGAHDHPGNNDQSGQGGNSPSNSGGRGDDQSGRDDQGGKSGNASGKSGSGGSRTGNNAQGGQGGSNPNNSSGGRSCFADSDPGDSAPAAKWRWEKLLRQGITDCTAKKKRLYPWETHPDSIRNISGLTKGYISVAIASVWEGLEGIEGNLHSFGDCSTPEKPVPSIVRCRKDIILPLMFTVPVTSDSNANPISHGEGHTDSGRADTVPEQYHWMLAVAKEAEPEEGRPRLVDIEIYDSAPGTIDPAQTMSRIKEIISDCGWLGTDWEGYNKYIKASKKTAIGMPCPRQTEGDTSALHTILNAWVIMLQIPLRRRDRPSEWNQFETNAFHKDARDIINLAMAGCMTSQTIQAFMVYHHYSETKTTDENLLMPDDGDAMAACRQMKTLRMWTDRFYPLLREKFAQDRLEAARDEQHEFPKEDMMAVMKEGGTFMAWGALVLSRGEVDGAVKIINEFCRKRWLNH